MEIESPSARDPASYKFWVDEHVRFADLDLLGHVNNKAYMTYGESGRVAFFAATRLWQADAPRQGLLARMEIDYLSELHYPAALRIGVRVLAIGRSAYTLGLAVFCGERCAATMVTVMVRIDTDLRKPTPLNDEERAALLSFQTGN